MSTTDTITIYDNIRKALAIKGALVALYRTENVTPKARVIVPERLYTTDDGADILRGWDSIRGTVISFRVDWFSSAALLPVKGIAA